MNLRRHLHRFLLLILVPSTAACDQESRSPEPRFLIDAVGLELPRLDGWLPERAVELPDSAAAGVAMRIIRDNAPPGSPRIDVRVEARPEHPITLDAYLHQNLRTMGQVESDSQADPATRMRITRVNQQPFNVGQRRAYLVRHEYTLGSGEFQMALTQLSTVLVIDGRGVTITALGRTELFHPLADPITKILTGIRVTSDPARTTIQEVAPAEVERMQAPKKVEAVDLGTVGGK